MMENVSDIHIEPLTDYCRIRFRRDGILYLAEKAPTAFSDQITARIKIMAQLNIAEKRLPQDGRILLSTPKETNIRVSICPTLFGEKIVLRILDYPIETKAMDTLGMTADQLALLHEKLALPCGLILISGSTGSGKTTTLYSALHYLNQIEKNIVTVEDPVEIKLDGIMQVNINTKIKLGFASALRALLRQDPDVIMIGEIRDTETALIAVQAAQTGHLVLSTMHGHQASDCLARLKSFGISSTALHHTISLIINQRLIETPHGHTARTGQFELATLENIWANSRTTV